MDISKFTKKTNKIDGVINTEEEEVSTLNGVYIGNLIHDNVIKDSLNIYTGSKLTGDKIANYFLSTPSETPWKYSIKILTNIDKVYISYEYTGDTVEAEDINNLQDELVRTQQEVNIIEANKADKDKVFTKEEILQKFNDLINSAPGTLDTLNEIATALGNDPNFSATIINLLNNKVDEVTGKQLSTEDYSTQEKNKLFKVEDNANNYIHPDKHPASMVQEDETHMFVTSEQKAAINTLGSDSVFETAGGTGNAITLTVPTLTNGLSKNFIASANNGGITTTINGKPVYKPGTTTPPTFKTGKAYTVWYNQTGDCFFIKASADGDADVSNVLATKKFSNDNDTGLTGTMPNNGALSGALNCGQSFNIPLGYTSGGTITANSLASQTSATALANYILYGYTAWVNATKITGTIQSKAAATITPGTVNQTIAAGQYLSGIQTILGDPNLLATYIKLGISIFGVAGSLVVPNFASGTVTSSVTQTSFNGQSHAYVDISGFNFVPKFALLINPNNTQEKLSTILQQDHFIVFPGNVNGIFVSIAGSAIVANGRLLMPANGTNAVYNYYIIG